MHWSLTRLALMAAIVLCGSTTTVLAEAWTTELVSEGFSGDVGNSLSTRALVSGNGRYVAFGSAASNLVAGVSDDNKIGDTFLFDRVTQTTTLISHAGNAPTIAASGSSNPVAISDDGNWVLFDSSATDVMAGVVDNNLGRDLFLYDRSSGTRSLITHAAASATTTAGSASEAIALSADGRWVLYESFANNLVAGATDVNGSIDVFLFDRTTGASTLVSRALGSPTTTANGDSYANAMSSDGNWVVYTSLATNIIGGLSDGNAARDAYLFDRSSGTATLVSRALGAAGTAANNPSYARSVSADGMWVLYSSDATNLISGLTDNNVATDVFLFNRGSGTSQLVSRTSGSATTVANNISSSFALSADGNRVLFSSYATNLVSGVTDGNGTTDIFLFDRVSGTNSLVSRTQASPLNAANNRSTPVALSADGNRVLFGTTATNIVTGGSDGNGGEDVFLFDAGTAATTLISRASSAATTPANGAATAGSMDASGNWIAYPSLATDGVAGVTDLNLANDVLLFDRGNGTNSLVSRAFGSAKSTPNNASLLVDISPDGNNVLYFSYASNALPGATDLNGGTDAILFDRSSGGRMLVSRSLGSPTTTANQASYPAAQSADGRWVLYYSVATDLIAGVTDSNGTGDVYLFDTTTGSSSLVSRNHGVATTTANNGSTAITLSANGAWVLYASLASDLVGGFTDGNGANPDLFLFERSTGTSTLVTRALGSATASANGAASAIALSPDGRWVLFQSAATNVVAGLTDTNGTKSDVFLFDRQTGSTLLVSRALGVATTTANDAANASAMSADASRVLYRTRATNVIPVFVDDNNTDDVFVFDRTSGTTTLISRPAVSSFTGSANGSSRPAAISPDGQWVLFTSRAWNLLDATTDTNAADDVFLFEMSTGNRSLVSRALGSPASSANGASTAVGFSDDGRRVLYFSEATNIVPGVTDSNGNFDDIFVFDRDSGTSTLISHAENAPWITAGASFLLRALISNDGSAIAWHSTAANVSGALDHNSETDVLVTQFRDDVFANGFE